MAEEPEIFQYEVSASAARLQRIIATLDKNITVQEQIGIEGNETLLRIRAMRARLTEQAAVPMGAGELGGVTSSLEQQNALRRIGAQLDMETLDLLKAQTKERVEQAAVTARLQREQGVATPVARRAGGAGELAGAQAAAEERARIRERILAPSAPAAGGPLVLPQERRAYTEPTGARAAQALEQEQRQLAVARELAAQQKYVNELASAEAAGRQKVLAVEDEQLAIETRRQQLQTLINRESRGPGQAQRAAYAGLSGYDAGLAAAQQGRRVSPAALTALQAPPKDAMMWTSAERGLVRYNVALGEYEGFSRNASLGTRALNSELLRVGLAETQASNAMRRHGALTTEYLSALARGETTVAEFGYQIGATVAKFAGWTAAAAATYTTLGALFEMGKGAVDASSGVQQLTRTIDNLDTHAATQAIVDLSRETNVPIKEASDAMFQFSRTFHSVADASAAAKLGLASFKLDQVDMMDTVKLTTELQTQYNLTLGQQRGVYDLLSAGQRQYNARMQQTIPALGISLGSVKNAGGDLTQLIQQIEYIQRTIPTQGGTRIGTAVYRSASNFLNPATPLGKKNLADLSQMGIDTTQGWTGILDQAIRKAPSLDRQQRSRMAQDIFYRQFGGRVGESIFGPEAVQYYQSITGGKGAIPGTRPITPAAASGSLQQELDRQLKTTRETMHSFINELQRLGAAMAETGALKAFVGTLHLVTGALGGIESVTSGFARLPEAARDATMALTTLGAALLFLNRTRFGSSVADLTRLSRIPHVGASETTRQRFDLRTGTRAAQQAIESDLQGTSTQLLQNSARRVELGAQRTALINAEGGEEKLTGAALERSNALNAQIIALQREGVVLEEARVAQLETLRGLNTQQTMLRKGPRRGGYSNEEVRTLGASALPNEANSAQLNALGAETTQQARTFTVRQIAQANLARALAIEQIAITENIAYGAVTEAQLAGVLTKEQMLASRTSTTAAVTGAAGARLKGMAGGLGGLVRGLNPMLLAMLGLPIVLGEIGDITSKVSDAAKAAEEAANAPLNGFNQLLAAGRKLQAVAAKQAASKYSGGPVGGLQRLAQQPIIGLIPGGVGQDFMDLVAGRDPGAAKESVAQAQTRTAIGDFYRHVYKTFKLDVDEMIGSKSGQQELWRYSQQAKGAMQRILASSGLNAKEQAQVMQAFNADLQQEYLDGVARQLSKARPQDSLDYLGRMTTQQLQQRTQAYGARAQAFGLSGGDMSKAAAAYLTLAGRERNDDNQQNLQQLSSAQQAFGTALNRNVTDITNAAKAAPTYGGGMRTLDRGLASLSQTRAQIHRWAEEEKKKWGYLPGFMKAIDNAANQLYALVDQAVATVVQQGTDRINAQASLAASRIGGIGPGADIQRAQALLDGYRRALANARAHHAKPEITGPLEQQVNNSARDMAQQSADYARSLMQAQGQIASASISGQGPGADLARARQEVANAASNLAFDKGHHADRLTIAQDYAALLQAQSSLDGVIQSNARTASQDAAALVQAQGNLAEAQTTDPVSQARIELQTAIRVLATIKPSDYNTYSEYQAAVINQQATIAKDRQNVTQQYVDVQMRNLDFERHIGHITDQEYINGLQRLLHEKKLTLQQRQQILTQIYDISHQAAVNLGTDQIKMPTEYEVRRGIRAGRAARDRQWSDLINATPHGGDNITNNRVSMNIVVNRDADLAKFAAVLDNALRGNFTGSAQAMGMI